MHGSARDRLAHRRAIPVDSVAPQPRLGQPAQAPAQHGPPSGQYAFLLQAGVSDATLAIADAEARRCGVPVHQVLLSTGLVSQTAYASALAGWLGVAVAGWDAVFHLGTSGAADDVKAEGAPAHFSGRSYRVLCAEDETPGVLRERIARLKTRGLSVALSTRFRLDAALDAHLQPARLDHAIAGLSRQQPACSAAGPTWIWQVIAAAVAVGLIVGGFSVLPHATLAAVSGIIAVPFLCVTLLRVIALREVIASPRKLMRRQQPAVDILPETLPLYTVMVPLFREVKVLPGLLQSLQAIVYPRAKLEILLVLEAVDIETQAAVLAMQLPGNFRTVVVPDQAPRTKPKALNYALQFARGEYVVVYDAEDRPEPDQLLRALTAFETRPAPARLRTGAAQYIQSGRQLADARYNGANARRLRHYTADAPVHHRILGPVRRHPARISAARSPRTARRHTLIATGGWDPFNVTEDADLGFRMARRGWRTTILASTTWEEAPVTIGQWIRQRTRWLKGWMQTYLVHTRRPLRLNAELGLRGAFGFHALMGALLLSALVHPLFYVLLTYHALLGELLTPSDTIAGAIFWTVASINLAGGYVASILVGALSVWRRGRRRLALSALFMPVIWLLMSAAAYRALWQLVRDPYLWEKTEHGVDQP